MKISCTLSEWIQPALSAAILATLVSSLGGCAMTEPLADKGLQEDLRDPNISIVVMRYEAPRTSSATGLFGIAAFARWQFAVANEATGWNFRRLDASSMIYHTRLGSLEADQRNHLSGWVTFLVPPGTSYIAVLPTSKPRQDCRNDTMDFTDQPHFVVQVARPQSVIYAGTISSDASCGTACNQGLVVKDESALAQAFAARYKQWFTIRTPMMTQLMSIPPTRTITINDAGTRQ